MFNAASLKKIILLLLAVISVMWLYALINQSLWQQKLQHKIALLTASSRPLSPTIELPSPQEDALLINDIALPVLPNLPAQTAANPALPSIAEPIQKRTKVAPTKPQRAKPVNKPDPLLPAPQFVSLPTVAQTAQQKPALAKPQSADEVYQQLHQDQSLDLQIALPFSASKRNQLLDYLYQCAGMQFAVLHITQKSQLSYLSPKRYVPVSQWLRVANGVLSPQEQQWLGQQSGTAIRIFPQAIDQRLSHFIASHLQGKKLSSLRASYSLTTAGLVLNNIELNKQSIKGEWQLHNSQCKI